MFARGGILTALVIAAVCAPLACGESAPEPAAPAPTPEASAPAPPPPAPPPAAKPAPAPAPAPVPAPEPPPAPSEPKISLEELGQRIKQTPAIGTFSKLALKNDIDDLVDDLRAYHERKEGDLDALHQRYEALVLKLLTLLEEGEPELALALSRSREEIWGRLVNPIEFAKLST
jgi:hypothetical protein